jgi:hypothetical protein
LVARPAVFHLSEVGRVLLSKVGKPALEALRRFLTRDAVGALVPRIAPVSMAAMLMGVWFRPSRLLAATEQHDK